MSAAAEEQADKNGPSREIAAPESPARSPGRVHFVLRRLHSLTGVAPIGVFLIEHLWTNAHAMYGPESFRRAIATLQSLPALVFLEVFGIALPLAFHALYGLVIAMQARPNVVNYPWTRNWLFVIQRVSGAIALVFIATHTWQYRLQKSLGALAWQDFYHRLTIDLNRPAMFVWYVTGVTATVFHFANGLWAAGNTWGITVTERSQRRAAWACLVVGAVLWVAGVDVILHFAYRCGGVVPLPYGSLVADFCGR